MKFTDRTIAGLKPRSERYEVWETGRKGLGVRVSTEARKTFIYMYRFQGKARRMSLGVYPQMSLADAHLRHAEAQKVLEQGIDPGAVSHAAKEEARRAPTVAVLAAEYLEKWAKLRKRSWEEDARILEKDVLPAWGQRKAREITRRDVIVLLDGIVARGAPIAANRTLACIRKMFNFALSRDIVQVSACAAVRAPSTENRRDRVLTEEEIRGFWTRLNQARMDEGTIPAQKSKNKLPHRVPLSPLVLEVLAQAREASGGSHHPFPSPRGDKPMAQIALGHALRKNLGVLGAGDFTPHDLRRTAASHMTGMGISRLTVSKILNHVERGITAVYDRHSYDTEKRQALEAWGDRLHQIIIGNTARKVVSLPVAGTA
jgi:integrase